MASRAYNPGEYFRRVLLARSSEQNLQVSDNGLEAEVEDSQDDIAVIGESASQIEPNAEAEDRPRGKTKSKGKRKAPRPVQAQSATKKTKKWAWAPEAVEVLLNYIKEYKTSCEFNGVDFEADLASMYTEVRRCMALDYAGDFGPESVLEPGRELKDMDSEEYESYRKELEDQKRMVRLGYQRIKEKIKNVRQDYRHAVNKGTRSGSGKVVQDNYDLLNDIWGGSPSTTSLSFGIDGDTPGTSGTIAGTSYDLEYEGSEASSGEAEAKKGKTKINVSNIPKLVDNKRKHMEKKLSQAQRDQILMSTAKEDMMMKKDMVAAFDRSNQTLDESISKMTTCLTSLGEGIASGMRMLAMALANPPATPSPAMYHTQNYPPQFGSQNSFSTSSVAPDTSYVRDAFPPSQFHCMGQGNGRTSPPGSIFAADQALYNSDSNDNSYNY